MGFVSGALKSVFGAVGGLVGVVGGLVGAGIVGQQERGPDAQVQRESKEAGRGASRVRQARAQRSRAAQLQTAMSFDGIGNEDGKIPFQKQENVGPLQEQTSIFQ